MGFSSPIPTPMTGKGMYLAQASDASQRDSELAAITAELVALITNNLKSEDNQSFILIQKSLENFHSRGSASQEHLDLSTAQSSTETLAPQSQMQSLLVANTPENTSKLINAHDDSIGILHSHPETSPVNLYEINNTEDTAIGNGMLDGGLGAAELVNEAPIDNSNSCEEDLTEMVSQMGVTTRYSSPASDSHNLIPTGTCSPTNIFLFNTK